MFPLPQKVTIFSAAKQLFKNDRVSKKSYEHSHAPCNKQLAP